MAEDTYSLDLTTTAKLVRSKREALKMSQYKLSTKSGVSRDTVRRIERGLGAKISDIYRICDALNITPLDIAPARFRYSEKLLRLGALLAQYDPKKQDEILDQINSLTEILLSAASSSP